MLKRLRDRRRPTARNRGHRPPGERLSKRNPEVRMEFISSAKAPGGRVVQISPRHRRVHGPVTLRSERVRTRLDGAAPAHGGGEDSLVVPDRSSTLSSSSACRRATCSQLGLIVSALGIVFGLVVFMQLKNAPVHKSMLEVSELIYETCKTYLVHAGEVPRPALALHRRRHRRLLRRAQGRVRGHRRPHPRSSASSASRAAARSRSSASA